MRIRSELQGQVPRVRFSVAALTAAMLLLAAQLGAAAPCDGWNMLSTPNVGNSVTRLTDVTVVSASDAWSVGLWRDDPAGRGPVAMHWDGSAWSSTSLPNTSHLGSYPETEGVGAAPNGDVWVVGNISCGPPASNLPLVLRWRGGSWESVGTVTLRPQTEYPFAPRGGFAHEVEALAPDDIWAVGQAAGFGSGGATSVPLAIHWDGSTWTEVNVPEVATRHHDLNGLVAISPDDVWAVGDYRNWAQAFHGVTYHWDGYSWSHVDSPIEHMTGDSGLNDVVAAGPNDVWAIGEAIGGVVLMHWDGSRWSLAEPPPNSGGSLAAVGPNDLWASGWNGFWHWDGTTWTEVPAQVPGSSYVIRSGGMAIVGGCDIWCAGFWTLADGITSFTLVERLHGAATASVEEPMSADMALTFANPFSRAGSIHLRVPSEERVRLSVFDVRGTRVRDLLGASNARGDHSLAWDGRSDSGRALPGGVYLLDLDVGGRRMTRKLLLLPVDP